MIPCIAHALYYIFIAVICYKLFKTDVQLNFRCIIVFLPCTRQHFLKNVSFVRCLRVIASVIVNKLLVRTAFLFDSRISSSNLFPDTGGQQSWANFVSNNFFSV